MRAEAEVTARREISACEDLRTRVALQQRSSAVRRSLGISKAGCMDSRLDAGTDSAEYMTSSSLGGRREPGCRPLIEAWSDSTSTAFSLPFRLGACGTSAAPIAEADDSPSFSCSGARSASAPGSGMNLNSEGSLDCCITLADLSVVVQPIAISPWFRTLSVLSSAICSAAS